MNDHIRTVKESGCVVCGVSPCDFHHVICDRFSMNRATDLEGIALCKCCHQTGPLAIHRGKRSWVERNGPDWSYLPRYLTEEQLKSVNRNPDGSPIIHRVAPL